MLLACNRRESEKESENGGKILRTRNGQKSKKEQGKGDTISLKSNWRINEREQEKIDAELATPILFYCFTSFSGHRPAQRE